MKNKSIQAFRIIYDAPKSAVEYIRNRFKQNNPDEFQIALIPEHVRFCDCVVYLLNPTSNHNFWSPR